MNPLLRRACAVVAAPVVALSALVVASGPASAASDNAPLTSGATWLESQLTDGLIQGAYVDGDQTFTYTDYGLSADAALALATIGGHDQTVDQISAALAGEVETWHTSFSEIDAGAVAKSLLVAEASGADPTDFGGVNLVSRLEERVLDADAGVNRGRLVNAYATYGSDFRSATSQALAVQALDALAKPSDETAAATDFLLEQQCAGGYFRQKLSELESATQTCDADPESAPDTDATAFAVLSLHSQLDQPTVAAAVQRAVEWLQQAQRNDGSFGGGSATEAPNANSTGLAGWALAVNGDHADAAHAAAWVRAHQLVNLTRAAGCHLYAPADRGAIAYNNTDRTAAAKHDLEVLTADPYRRATAQALPVLAWAPAGDATPTASSATGYVKAGSRQTVTVSGAAPGEAVCATLGGRAVQRYAGAAGAAHLSVRVPSGTATRTVKLADAGGVLDTVTLKALGAKTLRVSIRRERVAAGGVQVVTVRGLAPRELGHVDITWPDKKNSGAGQSMLDRATKRGVLVVRAEVPKRFGTAVVKAGGQFGTRKAPRTTFVVTR